MTKYREMSRYEITEEQWKKIKRYFLEKGSKRGRPGKSDQEMLNTILWIVHSGAAWRDLPERYGSWKTVYSRFAKWRNEGVSGDADFENLMIDSTFIKVHQSANGGVKKGNEKL